MGFDPSNIIDAKKRNYGIYASNVATNESGVALPVEITYADFSEFFVH